MSPDIPTRLVQLIHPGEGRRAALVYGNELHLLATYRSVYSFALAAMETGWKLRELLSTDLSGIVLDYAEIYSLATPWRFLPSFDHPVEPGRCLVSAAGAEWTYKGSGASLYGHGEPLPVSGAAPSVLTAPQSLGDLAAVYVIGPDGAPRRVGITPGNCSRCSAIGPELTLDADLPRVAGTIKVMRAGREVRSEILFAGEAPLLLALTAIEPDLFESADLRRPGDAHVHFFGARLFGGRRSGGRRSGGRGSGTRPRLVAEGGAEEGDEAVVEFEGLGEALRNPIRIEQPAARRVAAVPL